MKVHVLKDFACATDERGVKTRDLIAGTADFVPDDAFEGLKAEGYVAELTQEVRKAPEAVEVVPAEPVPAASVQPSPAQTLRRRKGR